MSWAAASCFYHQLGTSLAGGLAMTQAVDLATAHGSGRYRRWGPRLRAACDGGGTLADALADCGEAPLAVALVRAGETSGRLPELCERLVALNDAARATRNHIIARSLYPLLVLHLALVVPVLPGVVIGETSPLLMLLGPGLLWAIGIGAWLLWHGPLRAPLVTVLTSVPPGRSLVDPLNGANTCLVLHAAAAAGLLWDAALHLAADTGATAAWRQRLHAAAQGITDGTHAGLAPALAAAGLPRRVVDQIAPADTAGATEAALLRCATQERERFDARVGWAARIATGVLFATAALATAIVVIRFYLGYVDQLTSL